MASSPPSSFIWGRGGARLTPDEIERQRAIAAQLMTPDYSPIQSPWQGLARVAGNFTGALREARADSASTSNAEDQRRIVAALMNPEEASASATSAAAPSSSPAGGQMATAARPRINPAIIEALTSPYVGDEVRALAGREYQATQRRPVRPHYWETNNGSLGMIGPDGQPRILYNDPTPRTDYIMVTDPATGQQRFVQVPRAAADPQTDDPDYWTPIEEGGPTRDASGGFSDD